MSRRTTWMICKFQASVGYIESENQNQNKTKKQFRGAEKNQNNQPGKKTEAEWGWSQLWESHVTHKAPPYACFRPQSDRQSRGTQRVWPRELWAKMATVRRAFPRRLVGLASLRAVSAPSGRQSGSGGPRRLL